MRRKEEENTMQNQPSIRRNFLMNTILRSANVLFPLITISYVSRILLSSCLGRVSFATSFIAYFNMAAQLGIPTYGVRACAKVRDDQKELSRVTLELLLLNLIGTIISYAAVAFCILFIPRVRADGMLFIILSLTVVLNAIGMEWLYQGLEQYTYITIRSLVFKTVALAAVFLLVHEQEDVLVYAGISIFASSASNILNFFHARKYVDLCGVLKRDRSVTLATTGYGDVGSAEAECGAGRTIADGSEDVRAGEYQFGDGKTDSGIDLRRHLRPVFILFAMVCAVTVFSNLDEVMLGFIRTDAEVGIYHAAVRIKIALVDVITALSVVLLPRASYYVEHRQTEDFLRITDKGMHFVLLCGAGLTVFFMLYARETVLFLFGSEFEASVLPMIMIMPVVLLTGMTRVMGNQILIPQGREKIVLRSVAAGTAADVVLNTLLIPGLGPVGAVVGTLAAELVIVLIQYPKAKTEVGDTVHRLVSWKIAGALAFSIGASLWVKMLPIGPLYRLLLSSILFFAVYIVFLLLTGESMVIEVYNWLIEKIKRVR